MNAEMWSWVVIGLGCVPWLVERRTVKVKDGRRLRVARQWQVQAIFWQVTWTRCPRRRAEWQVRVPLLERLQKAVWAAVQSLFR